MLLVFLLTLGGDRMEIHKGLEGVIVSETKISSIVENQLLFAGYNIDELVEKMSPLRKLFIYCGI